MAADLMPRSKSAASTWQFPHFCAHSWYRVNCRSRQRSPLRLLEREPTVERQPSRPPCHDSNGHGRPGYVHGPAVRNSKLDHESHHQECARSQSGCQAENEEDGKENLGGADKECGCLRGWK